MQWKHANSAPSNKARVTLSAGKVMATFFYSKGIILTDFFDKMKDNHRTILLLPFGPTSGRNSKKTGV